MGSLIKIQYRLVWVIGTHSSTIEHVRAKIASEAVSRGEVKQENA
jgi:hypothetical protein